MSKTQSRSTTVLDHDPISRSVVDLIRQSDPEVADVLVSEADRQSSTLELIASENHVTSPVMHAAGTWMTNKYAEGYPGKRYYGGCEFHDVVEDLARERAKELFQCGFRQRAAALRCECEHRGVHGVAETRRHGC